MSNNDEIIKKETDRLGLLWIDDKKDEIRVIAPNGEKYIIRVGEMLNEARDAEWEKFQKEKERLADVVLNMNATADEIKEQAQASERAKCVAEVGEDRHVRFNSCKNN